MSITIEALTAEETFFIEGILKRMNIPYKKGKSSDNFTKAQEQSIIRGLKQAEKGVLKPNNEVISKARVLCGL